MLKRTLGLAAACCLALAAARSSTAEVERLPPVALVAANPNPAAAPQVPAAPPQVAAAPANAPPVEPPIFPLPAPAPALTQPSGTEPVLIPPTPENVPLPSELIAPHLLGPGDLGPPARSGVAPESIPAGIPTEIIEGEIVEPAPAPTPKLWCGRIEAGINGAEGNTQLFELNFGAKAARETPRAKLKFDLYVARSENFGELTENKAILDVNNDWNIPDSPYAWFVSSLTEYDEFRNFDVRLTLHSGLTYHARKGPRGFLDLRAGAGTSREIGSPDTQFVPETKLGFDMEYKISPRQKISGSTDAFIDVSDPKDQRVNSRAGYGILIDEQRNLNLEFAVLNRYDSTPHGAKPNDLDYNILFFWEF